MNDYKIISSDLYKNVNIIIKAITDNFLITRFITNAHDPTQSYCLIYLSNLVDKEVIHNTIMRPLLNNKEKIKSADKIEESIIIASDIKSSNLFDEIIYEILRGKTIVLIDNEAVALMIDTNKRDIRLSNEPDGEKSLRGPREGFAESILYNVSLVRRRIISPDFKVEMFELGTDTQTKYCLCYLENMIDEKLLEMVKARLAQIEISGILDTNFIVEKIKDNPKSPFKTIGITERPDVFAAKLLEGKVGLIIDGSPVTLTMPFLFIDNFQISDDYYINFYFASLGRILRIIGFIFAIMVPSLYVAITTHHWEVIPSPLALTIAHSHQDVPLPTVLECIMMLLIFDIIREAGLRTPLSIGQALSIVGAIVIGQAAVQARLVSSPMVIVVALTAISSLINPSLKGVSAMLRFYMLFFSTIMGLFGIVIGSILLLTYLISHKSFTLQYTEKFFPFKQKNLSDSFVRLPKDDINTKER